MCVGGFFVLECVFFFSYSCVQLCVSVVECVCSSVEGVGWTRQWEGGAVGIVRSVSVWFLWSNNREGLRWGILSFL